MSAQETTDNLPYSRSPFLMSRHDTGLLVVDLQQKLVPLIAGHRRLVWNVERLLDSAKILGLRTWATEQYPQGLGPSVQSVVDRLSERPAKQMFSCRECADLWMNDTPQPPTKMLLAGIETHICVQQTTLDLLSMGVDVYLAVDAMGARGERDHEIALRRMESAGATLTTTEAAMFEWCEVAGTPEFKQISGIVLQTPPEPS